MFECENMIAITKMQTKLLTLARKREQMAEAGENAPLDAS